MSIIQCEHLTKIFSERTRKVTALHDVSFDLEEGRLVGLLGPDGAGKTTLLRHLCGLLRPDAGTIKVLGFDTVRDARQIQSLVGYMPQKFGLYENLSVTENINLYARLHGISQSELNQRVPRLLERNNLSAFTARMAGKLSGGMKQKLALVCALISRPKLMLLDEPTVGVDVLARRELWQILRQTVEEESMSALVSSTYMDEADYCDQALVLFDGKLVARESPAEITRLAEPFGENPTFEKGFQVLISGSVPASLTRKRPVEPDAPVVIRAEGLIKRFGDFTAVNRISFNVRRGEIFGLLGANGAGKTTTFRMLCGLSGIEGGTIEIDGRPLKGNLEFARSRIGYVAQKFSLYGDISVRQNLDFFGGAYGLSGSKLRDRIDWAMTAFELQKFAAQDAGLLPMGFKRRLAMACALLHEPPILFLDEATSGADPMARREFWRRIIELADSGVAVVVTTHFLDEAAYCDQMVIMRDGESVAAGAVEDILLQGGGEKSLEEAFVNIVSRKTTPDDGVSGAIRSVSNETAPDAGVSK